MGSECEMRVSSMVCSDTGQKFLTPWAIRKITKIEQAHQAAGLWGPKSTLPTQKIKIDLQGLLKRLNRTLSGGYSNPVYAGLRANSQQAE